MSKLKQKYKFFSLKGFTVWKLSTKGKIIFTEDGWICEIYGTYPGAWRLAKLQRLWDLNQRPNVPSPVRWRPLCHGTPIKKNLFEMGPSRIHFDNFFFSIQLMGKLKLPLAGFQPRISGDGSNRSTICATTSSNRSTICATTSVTRWLDYLFNIWPFRRMEIWQML